MADDECTIEALHAEAMLSGAVATTIVILLLRHGVLPLADVLAALEERAEVIRLRLAFQPGREIALRKLAELARALRDL